MVLQLFKLVLIGSFLLCLLLGVWLSGEQLFRIIIVLFFFIKFQLGFHFILVENLGCLLELKVLLSAPAFYT